MPTYDYECSACGHRFDELQSFSDPVLTKCPKCKKNKLVRLFGGGGAVIFKGTGFYETDYRRAGQAANNGETAEAPKTDKTDKTEAKAETKTETKSESAPAPKPESNGKSGGKGGGGKKNK